MYLKNIEVQGFKSFAQKINFEFHNGITGIVGPNGSGKSNVGDAVRWVLGEQSAKQLRGGNMQDVIFSGTESRRPLSFASVAITLDNSDRKLPVDYREVTVTRRLYRSGESEYLLNGSNCRLRDIHELFYDTGIGKEGYSIIGQGQIDKILSGKPEERRELFDEAAGIVKFKRRKQTAMKKLEDERQNMVRVTDILNEITRQLGPLEKQSEKARIYLGKKEELKTLDVNLFLLDLKETGEQLEQLKEKQADGSGELAKVREDFETTRREYDRLEKELEAVEEEMNGCREQAQENALREQKLSSQRELVLEQIRAAEQQDGHYRERSRQVEEELKRRQEELENYQEEQLVLSLQKKDLEKRQKEAALRLEKTQSDIRDCAREVESGKSEIIEILNNRATTKGKVQRYDAVMEQIGARKAHLARKALEIKSGEEALEEELSASKERLRQGDERMEALFGQSRELEAQAAKLQEEIRRQNQQMDVGQTAYHREASRLESLKNLTERYDGYGNSIKRVMEQKERIPGIRGVVADLIQVDKNYETAIETALGGNIQNVVTDHEQTAKKAIEFLKKNRFGRATFLPLNHISGRGGFSKREALKEEGVIGLACDLVKVQPEHEALAKYLLGRTLVVDHIDHAIAIGKKYDHSLRMVTVEGESLSPGGSMTGGAFKNTSNLLGRRREIQELEESVRILKQEMERMQEEIQRNRQKRDGLRDAAAGIQEELQKCSLQQNTEKMNFAQLQSRREELEEDYRKVQRENQEIQVQIREVEATHQDVRRELELSVQDEKELEEFIQTRQQELEEYRIQEGEDAHLLEEVRMEMAGLTQKEGFQRENVRRVSQETQGLLQEQEELAENLKKVEAETGERKSQIGRIEEAVREAQEKVRLEKSRLLELTKRREEKNAVHKAFFEKRDALSQQIGLLDKECYRLGSQMEKLEEAREKQIAYMWEEYEITPGSAAEYKKEELRDIAAMRKQIQTLKEGIRALGDVNVNAIEDYKELSERHCFLSAQYEDLVKAEATLMDIITELDEGMRRQFSEKFYEIQREFDRAFKELFGGGKGTLELLEDEDVLEAGIRIIAQPPGKKLQNMMQLSGGEKALSAIALLFAIQNLKPSPFCLLDEIEAALDDSNVNRFADYLQKLTANTQFIIITHRRGTMRAADRLYGITMQEKGVSTLVSVDLVEKELDQ